MKSKKFSKSVVGIGMTLTLVLAIGLIIIPSTEAANTWDGGSLVDSNWGTAANWDNDAVPASGQTLTFDGSTRLGPSNDTASRQVKAFIFAAGAGAFTLSGTAITLIGNVVNSAPSISNLSANTQTINLDMATSSSLGIALSDNALTLGGVISGSGDLVTKNTYMASQSGTLTLSGNNSFTGGVQLVTDAGYTKTLNIGHANALGTGLLTISGGSTSSNRIDNTSGADMIIANNVSALGNGSSDGPRVRFLGTNNLTINGSFSNGSNRIIQVDAKTLTLAGNVYLAAANTAVATLSTGGVGKLTIGGVVSNYSGVGGFAGSIKVLDSATLELLNGSNTYTGVTTLGVNFTSPTLVVTKLADGGQASSIGASSNAATNLVAAGVGTTATLRYTGSGDSTDHLFSMTDSGNTFAIESSGSGALHFTNSGAMTIPNTGARTLVLGGTYAGVNTMDVALTTGANTALDLRKEGAGTWNLTNTNGYARTTTVNAGTLLVSGAGSINATSGVAVNGNGSKFSYTSSTGLSRNVTLATGGGFYHNGSTNYSGALTWTNGTLGGTNLNGNLGGLTVGANQILSPGNSVGTATTTSQTWASLGAFNFEVNKANGTAGLTAGGWDLLNLSSTLSITATSGSKFTINLISLGLDNLPGATDSFVSSTDYKWLFADSANAITGFSADKFAINTSGFTNSFAGTFGVALGDAPGIGGDNSQLYLTYAAIPEPNVALLVGIGLATVLLRRRRA